MWHFEVLWLYNELLSTSEIYCDVPGSPCLSKTGPVYGPFFLKIFRLALSCHCLEPGSFVGDPTPLARDNILLFDKAYKIILSKRGLSGRLIN